MKLISLSVVENGTPYLIHINPSQIIHVKVGPGQAWITLTDGKSYETFEPVGTILQRISEAK